MSLFDAENTLKVTGPGYFDSSKSFWEAVKISSSPRLLMTTSEIRNVSKKPVNIYIAPEAQGGVGSNQYSNLVWVHTIKTLSLDALRLFIPAVQFRMTELPANHPTEKIVNIILPYCPMQSYVVILQWIEDMIEGSFYKPYPTITEMPLWHYKDVIKAAQILFIEPLYDSLKERINQMLKCNDRHPLSLDMLDVFKFYQSPDHNDPLRIQVVSAVERARKAGTFSEEFKKEYKEFLERYHTCGLPPIEG